MVTVTTPSLIATSAEKPSTATVTVLAEAPTTREPWMVAHSDPNDTLSLDGNSCATSTVAVTSRAGEWARRGA
jgi:hypothetical protein